MTMVEDKWCKYALAFKMSGKKNLSNEDLTFYFVLNRMEKKLILKIRLNEITVKVQVKVKSKVYKV